jgi:hypothetical protein
MHTKNVLDIFTAGELLPDCHVIEPIRRGSATGLVHWDGKKATVAPEVLHGGRRYLPVQIPKDWLDATHLPERIAHHGSTRRLFTELHHTFEHLGGQPDSGAARATFFSFGSWLAGVFSTGLRLEIVGSDAEAFRMLQILSCISRHPVLLYLTNRAELLKIPLELQPTLLFYAPNADRATRRFLRSPTARGLFVQNGAGEPVNFNAPTVFYLGEDAGENSSPNCRIVLPVTPLSAGIRSWSERAEREIAEKFQAMLLDYRLRNLANVSRTEFDAPAISSPLREQANALGACIAGDDELRSQLVAMAAQQDEDTMAERAHSIPAAESESALSFCHEDGVGKVYIGKLTERVNVVIKARGTKLVLKPEAVGAHLRRLGIFTERLGSKGRGFYLTEKNRRLIHELARRYDVPSIRDGVKRCQYCTDGQPSRKTN